MVAFEWEGARPAGLVVVQHIATVAALHLSTVRHERETLRREGAETLAELLQDVLEPAVAGRRLNRLSVEGDTVLLVVCGAREDVVLDHLDELPHLLLSQGDEGYVLGPTELGPTVPAVPGVDAGMSRAFRLGDSLRVAQREALWAVRRAEQVGRPLVQYGDDPTGRRLGDSLPWPIGPHPHHCRLLGTPTTKDRVRPLCGRGVFSATSGRTGDRSTRLTIIHAAARASADVSPILAAATGHQPAYQLITGAFIRARPSRQGLLVFPASTGNVTPVM